MRFTHDGTLYGLSFQRARKAAPPHAQPNELVTPVTRMVTTAFLHRQTGPKAWTEVSHATITRNHRDEETREQGRLRALARLAPFVAPELRPLMFQAYFNRRFQKVT